jgi:signal transduction histidine kinase
MHTSEGQILFILTGATLILGGLIGYFLYSLARQFERYRKQQDGYNQAKLDALEQERRVISADLHDDIGPLLSAALLKLSTVNPEEAREKEFLQQADGHIREIYTRIRELSVQMVPRGIEKKGPFYALDEFAESCLQGQDLRVDITLLSCPALGEYRSLHLFRILQEILHNTIKHAGAQLLEVDARIEGNELFVETRDDGRGFELAAAQEKGGLGLQNITVRARMIGARLIVQSSPGNGTRYSIQLPLTEETTNHDSADPGHLS